MQTTLRRWLRRARPIVFAAVGVSMLAGQSGSPAAIAARDRLAQRPRAVAHVAPGAIVDRSAAYGIAEPGNTLPRPSEGDLRHALGARSGPSS